MGQTAVMLYTLLVILAIIAIIVLILWIVRGRGRV
jgi:hypothetical protein